ncbi:MAG: MBL fold metallo-hydrolase [Bacteroidetes bacterium]|nr:MAG: MBL fold metallo-hydrolase [Bacteroidota bacterium]
MKLTVLNDNAPGGIFSSEHGLSYIIEDDKTLLFDVGPSDVFIKNAKKANIDLNKIDIVALSHGHYDHGNGLLHLKNKTLICHPESFIKRYSRNNTKYIGLPISIEHAKKKFNLITTTKPYNISDNIIFLGEIPRENDFEAKSTTFNKEDGSPDFVIDDSALVIKSEKGLIIVTGCSHSGICNIINYAIKVTGNKNVYAVIGGFHLKKADEVTMKVINFIKNLNIKKVYPSHCTELPALSKFYEHFKIKQVKSGDVFIF